jgi:DNA-binding LacI/PurR family transcriptional regulator
MSLEQSSRPKAATIKDIARAVGVSPRSVSAALNNSGRVSPATKERILTVAKEMNYSPNVLARGLVQHRTYLLGALFPYASVSFFNEIISGIEKECSLRGYDLLLGNASLIDEREEPRALMRLVNRNVDGILCAPDPRAYQLFGRFADRSLPLVQVMTRVQGLNLPFVGVDNDAGGYMAARHLLDLGHERIGFLQTDRSWYAEIHDRRAGYLRALLEAGVKIDVARYTVTSDLSIEGGYRAMRTLLARAPDVQAVFAPTDYAAIGAIRACMEAGRRVPEQCSVVGYDDLELARRQIVYPLTTVAQPKQEIGTIAFQLFEQAADGETPEPVLKRPSLVVRETTAPPGGAAGAGGAGGAGGAAGSHGDSPSAGVGVRVADDLAGDVAHDHVAPEEPNPS